MSTQLVPLTIDGIIIRQDAEGRFCLNDLHKAAGGEKRHQPSNWLQVQQTQELVEELEKSIPGIPGVKQIQPLAIKAGAPQTGGGTYVCRDLVYDYAMWISPAFRVKVIRTYDSVMTAALEEKRYGLMFRPDLQKVIRDLRDDGRAKDRKILALMDQLAARLPVLALRYGDGPAHMVLFQDQPFIVADHAARIIRQTLVHVDRLANEPDTARQVLVKHGIGQEALSVLKLKPLMERYDVTGEIVCHAFGVSERYRAITLLPVWRMAQVAYVWPDFWPWLCRVALPLVPTKPELSLSTKRLAGGAA